jgi:hypothetical protein
LLKLIGLTKLIELPKIFNYLSDKHALNHLNSTNQLILQYKLR